MPGFRRVWLYPTAQGKVTRRVAPRNDGIAAANRTQAAAEICRLLARNLRPEGKTLSSTDTLENNPHPETAEAAQDHDHTQEGHSHEGHDHEGHIHSHEGHDHTHGPVLNPDCTRELVLDIPAEDVSKAYRAVTGNYRKYAKIPGFRA